MLTLSANKLHLGANSAGIRFQHGDGGWCRPVAKPKPSEHHDFEYRRVPRSVNSKASISSDPQTTVRPRNLLRQPSFVCHSSRSLDLRPKSPSMSQGVHTNRKIGVRFTDHPI